MTIPAEVLNGGVTLEPMEGSDPNKKYVGRIIAMNGSRLVVFNLPEMKNLKFKIDE